MFATETITTAYSFREILPSDQSGICALHRLFFKQPLTPEIFKWRYYKNPAGPLMGSVALFNNTIVGCYLVMPVYFKIHKEIRLLYQGANTIIHPEHQGKFLLKQLFENFKTRILALNPDAFLIGNPNEEALIIGKRFLNYGEILDWRRYQLMLGFSDFLGQNQPFWMRWLLQPADLLFRHLLRTKFLLSVEDNIGIEKAENIPVDYEEFLSRVTSEYAITRWRDRNFVQWYFFNNPQKNCRFFTVRSHGRLLGYFVLQSKNRELVLLDLFVRRKPVYMNSVLRFSVDLALRERFDRFSVEVHDGFVENAISRFPFRFHSISSVAFVDLSDEQTELKNTLRFSPDWSLISVDSDLG